MTKFLLSSLILFITFSVVVKINPVLAQGNTTAPTQIPQTLEEVKIRIQNILSAFPGTLKGTWNYALGVWKRTFVWMKDFWDSSIGPHIVNLWHKIRSFFGKEVEQRKPAVEEEFEREKGELKEEIPKTGKKIWQRLKELIW